MSTGLVWILVIAVFLWLAMQSSDAKSSRRTSRSTNASKKRPSEEWLHERWDRLTRERQNGQIVTGPEWFFDPATDRQRAYAEELGISVNLRGMSKGQVSDLIGLHHDPDDSDLEILRYFKERIGSLNQTLARDRAAVLLSDPARRAEFENRPASSLQRAVLAFAEIDSKGVKSADVNCLIAAKAETIGDDDWLSRVHEYEDILEQFEDKDLREEHSMKKPSAAKVRKAVETLETQGLNLANGEIDADIVADELIQMHPDLARDDL